MLSPDDEQKIESVLNEFARRGQTGAAETAALLSRLPSRPEALDHLIDLARVRGLPWIEYLARTVSTVAANSAPAGSPVAPPPMPISGAQLSAVLASSEPYPAKVEALLAALRGRHPELPAVIRKHLVGEADPFVLATLASALGQCGTPLDGSLLAPLLSHPDQRVVANALDSMRRLKAPPRAEVMVRLLEAPDNRVRTNAIAFLGVLDPDRALDLVRALVTSQEPGTRAGVAFVLGELPDKPGATELLLEMNEREQNMVVLKQIALALKKHSGPDTAGSLVGALHATREAASGAKRSVVGTTLHEIAVEAGLVLSEVEQLAAMHRQRHGLPEPTPASPTTMPASVPVVPFSPVASARLDAPASRSAVAPVKPASAAFTTASFAVMPPAAPTPALTTAQFHVQPVPVQPPPSAAPVVEGDEDLSFANVWGNPPPAGTTSGTMRIPPKSTRSGVHQVPGRSDADHAAPLAARRMPWGWLGAGAVGVALASAVVVSSVRVSTDVASAPGGSPSPAVKAPRKGRLLPPLPSAAGPARDAQNPIAAHLGPAGAAVKLSGKIVGLTSGKPVVECKGHYYLVVRRGKTKEELKRGQTLTLAGRIMGSSADGLFYVEENAR